MSEPIQMLLWCPMCHARHIDVGEFATKVHHTHACQGCGMVWRPAIEPTCGVEFLPGFKNADDVPPPAIHVIWSDIALCGAPHLRGDPRTWTTGDRWVRLLDIERGVEKLSEVTCKGCTAEVGAYGGPARFFR